MSPRVVPVWMPRIAASVAVLLVGCASPHVRAPEQVSQPAQTLAVLTDLGASGAGTLRIAQQRVGNHAAFRLVAAELPPTPKTLADRGRASAAHATVAPATAPPGASTARAAEPARVSRTLQARVREPVGSVYFASAGSQVSAAALPMVAAAVARAGRSDRVVLTAYTDPYGTRDENRRLAERRAEAVTTALAARGVDRAQVVVLSRPQCCVAQPLPERDAAPYRRVDIELLTHRAVLSEEPSHGLQHSS